MALSLSSFIPAFFIIIITLRTITCYYVRYWYRRHLTFHPLNCNTQNYVCNQEGKFAGLRGLISRKAYRGDGLLSYFHKYFIWTTLLLLPIHLYSVFPVFVKGWISGFSFEAWDVSIEALYLVFGTLFAISCHSIKYFFDRKAQCGDCIWARKGFRTISNLNQRHGFFLWATVALLAVRFALLLVFGTPVFTAMEMLFIRE